MPTAIERLNRALLLRAREFAVQLSDDDRERLSRYYDLLLKWNPRLHLVAPCEPEEFVVRHILESLVLLPHLPHGARITDVGSGAGLPIIPCLIMRPDLCATLIESSSKKAVFLREALRETPNPERPQLTAARFEDISPGLADFITCRALDRFQQALPTLIDWAPSSSTLLLFGGPPLRAEIERLLPLVQSELIPGSDQRFLMIARRNQPLG